MLIDVLDGGTMHARCPSPVTPKCQGHRIWWGSQCIEMSSVSWWGWGRGGWLAASSSRAPRPSQRTACLPVRAVGRGRATVESEGWVLEGRGSLLWQGWESASQEACWLSWGMVLDVLPTGWAQRLFRGTSVRTRQFCYFVPCGKFGLADQQD